MTFFAQWLRWFEACSFPLSYQDQTEGPEIALVGGLETG